LACAAVSAGSAAAQDVLDSLPDLPNLLRRVASDSGESVAALADEMLGDRPARPSFELTTTTLGKMTLRRDGEVVTADGWARRSRVRELWALLLERRRLHRFDVIELMWPSYEDDRKAATNLRSTLSALQGVLEPNRSDDSPPFFLTLDHEHLAVADGMRSDADIFDDLVAAAQADDNAGLPGRALDTYRQAVDLYQGDYLDGIDAAWAVLTRLRLRSLAVSAACRVAELTSAKGEPEEAARMARQAQMFDERSERAGRVLVAALDASGDRSAAQDAATHLSSVLHDSGIELSTETTRLFIRILGTSAQ
jgi:two-component SAPR family response regulator